MPPRQRPPVLRGIATLLLLVQFAACTSWSTQSGPPGEVVMRENPDRVRVSLSEGREITLVDVSATPDSLIGASPSSDQRVTSPRVAIALADIRSLETSNISAARTLGLIGGIGGAWLALFGLSILTGWGDSTE